ncbi:MAG TPA: transporter substrate-binding domain-containing protein [Candidatus Baltobacteraceae bacterium]|jgi:polar amino acid transport system substrate-binding protein
MKLVRRLLIASLTALVLGLWVAAPASARDTLADIKQRGKLIVGVKTDYKPFGFLDPSGKVVGIEPDLAADVAKRLGVGIEYVPVVAANRIQFLQQGRIDLMIATMTDTPAREEQVGIVKPSYYAAGVDIIARKASGLKSWDDLKGKSLCGIQGAFYNKDMQDKYGATVVAFPGTPEALNALRAGTCIGFVYDDSFNNPLSLDPAWSGGFDLPLASIDVQPWGLAVDKGDDKFMAFMSDVVKDWHKKGTIIALEKKYNVPVSTFSKQMNADANKK